MVTVIHPSRGRPEQAKATFNKWVKSASTEIQWILSLDSDDQYLPIYKKLFNCEVIVNDNNNLIGAVYKAIPYIKNDCVIVVSDDFSCPDGWDKLLKTDKDIYAIYVNDGFTFGKRLMTIPIVSKSLIDKMGYIYYPGYSGMFADNDLYEYAEKLNCLITKDIIFEHKHFSNGKAKIDNTYRRHNNNQSWGLGEKLLEKRRSHGFNINYIGKPKLSILIATLDERKEQFNKLGELFNNQIYSNCLEHIVEIVSLSDNRTMSIGAKRQKLLEMAKGEWVVFFDDDDYPYPNYVKLIVNAINNDVDCIGINGVMTTNGRNTQKWCHRLGYPIVQGRLAKQKGFDYLRPIIHFNPVLRSKALQAGFKDMGFGEDMDYALRLNKLLTKEVYIKEPLFLYRYIQKSKASYG